MPVRADTTGASSGIVLVAHPNLHHYDIQLRSNIVIFVPVKILKPQIWWLAMDTKFLA